MSNPWSNLQLPQETVIITESNKFKKKNKPTIYLEEDEYKNDRQLRLLADLENKINTHKNKNKTSEDSSSEKTNSKQNNQQPNSLDQNNNLTTLTQTNQVEEQKTQKQTNIFAALLESDEEQEVEESQIFEEQNIVNDENNQKIEEKQQTTQPIQELRPVPIQNNLPQPEINVNQIVKPVIKKPKKKPIKKQQTQTQPKKTHKKHKKGKSMKPIYIALAVSSIVCALFFLLARY